MATTGTQFYKLFTDSIDMEYGGFMSEIKSTRLAKDALNRIIELKYSGLTTEKQYDELSALMLLDQGLTVRGNRVRTSPLTLANVLGSGAITTDEPHQLQVGDTITLSGVLGFNLSVDGTYTVLTVPSTTDLTVTFPVVTGLWMAYTGTATHPYMYADMLHPFAMKVNTVDKEAYPISGATGGVAPTITFNRPNPIREGSRIRIANTTGLVGLNGDYYLKRKSLISFFIYTDVDCTVVPTVTGTYQGGATATLLISEVCTKLTSDRRIAVSYTPTVWRPKFGIEANGFNIYPLERACESMACDYMRRPQVDIDCLEATIDLEVFYTLRLLMRIKDEMVKMYYERMREDRAAQVAAIDEQMNP